MSNSIRKLQREAIRNRCYRENGNTKAFKSEWDKLHSKRVEVVNADGTTSSVRKRSGIKKRRFNDNGKLFVKQFKAMKSFISEMKDKQNKTKGTKTKIA